MGEWCNDDEGNNTGTADCLMVASGKCTGRSGQQRLCFPQMTETLLSLIVGQPLSADGTASHM